MTNQRRASINQKRIDGIAFENFIHSTLEQTSYPVLSEADIRREFGKDITAIDHLIKFGSFFIAIQDKWRASKNANSDINHYIHCVNMVQEILGIPCLAIYISRLPNTGPSQMAFDRQNEKQFSSFISIYGEDQTTIYRELMQVLYSNGIYFYDPDGALQMIDN